MPTKEWVTTITWKCLACQGEPEFAREGIEIHMREAHGLKLKTAMGTRRGFLIIDGEGFLRNVIEHEFGDLKFVGIGPKVPHAN